MATASDTAPVKAVKQWEMLLECSICTETLTQPRTLSCFHSFCKHCLGNFVAAHRKKASKAKAKAPEVFECPVCRTEFHVKEGESVDKMPSNHFINNMLELLTLQQQAERVKCQSCRAKNPAISRCISCENYLCEKCMEVHKTWLPFEHHIVLTLEELAKPENRAKARAKPRCEKHDKVLKFYCETCKVLVCRYCVDVNHARLEHLWFPLADVIVQHKEALKTSSAIFEQLMNEAVQSNLKIKHAVETLKNNTTKAKVAVMRQQEEILNAFTKKLEEETAVLLNQVDMKYNEVNEPLLKQQAEVKAYFEKTKSSLEFAKNIISNGTDEEILSFKHEVEEKAGNMWKERPELMDPVHSGAIQYQAKPSKDVLEVVHLNDLGKIDLDSVLQRKHKSGRYKWQISDKQPQKAPRFKKTQADNVKAYLGEVRTVIVSGLCPDTTDQLLEMFFENSRRTGGGKIEKLERCQPDVAHITFVSAEVAAQVLEHVKLELDGYLLQLKEKQPELILPLDRKKLYVENIDLKTCKDSLCNYIEVKARIEVCDIEFGENGSALVTFNEEPDVKKILENSKRLEGAVLKISNPPVCNSILVTGFTKNTTKEAIEMYFENQKNGGGKIYGDIIYQKYKGKAVVSFCDPQVVQTTSAKQHKLNGSVLSVRQHYQFMQRIRSDLL